MEQPQTNEERRLFSALKRHHLDLKEENDHVIIRKGKGRNASLQTQITFAAIGLVAGILIYIFFLSRLGMALIIGSGIYLVTLMNLREREKDSAKKYIRIGNEQVEIKEGYKGSRVKIADIGEIKTSTFKSKEFLIGKINLITKDNKFHQLLEIYGQDELILASDVATISNYLNTRYFKVDKQLNT